MLGIAGSILLLQGSHLRDLLQTLQAEGLRACSLQDLLSGSQRNAVSLLLPDCPPEEAASLGSLLRETGSVLHILCRSKMELLSMREVHRNSSFLYLTVADISHATPIAFCAEPSLPISERVRDLLVLPGKAPSALPSGVRVHEVTVWSDALASPNQAETVLPLCRELPCTAFPVAAMLSVLSAEQANAFLLSADPGARFDPSTGAYTLHPQWIGMHLEPLLPCDRSTELLQNGVYLLSRVAREWRVLYGYDPKREQFLARSFTETDPPCDIRLPKTLTEPLERICIDPTVQTGAEEAFYRRIAASFGEADACTDTYTGWRAAVAFVNRFSTQDEPNLCALETFLQEQIWLEKAFSAVRERFSLQIEPLERYRLLLYAKARERTPLADWAREIPVADEYLRCLSNAQEACMRAFCLEWEQLHALLAFMEREKDRT